MKNHLIEFTCKRNRDKYIEILEKGLIGKSEFLSLMELSKDKHDVSGYQ